MEDVIIVGGGPVGLMLACELKLSGVDAVVLERLPRPTGLSKALGVQGAGVALLELRGLLPRFGDLVPSTAGFAHFARMLLPVERLEGPKPRFLLAQQAIVEDVLEKRALELGVELRRGVELKDLRIEPDGVTLHTGDATLRARYVAGCDGARSAVRHLAGIDFPGEPAAHALRLGDVKLDADVTVRPGGVLIDGKPAPLGFGFPLGGGFFRVITREPISPDFDRSQPLTLDELNASVARVFGTMPRLKEPRWLSTFTDASRQAAEYRKGRVLLAGDAAHIHLPAGGPGLSTGLCDAGNLGWKLARVLKGASETLLDTYHAERHPVGARVLMHTRAQSLVMTPGANATAMRALLSELFAEPHALRVVSELLQGTDTRHDGRPFTPGMTVHTPRGERPLSELLRLPRGLLLDATGELERFAQHPSLDVVRVTQGPSRLIRPDGFVAWEAPDAGLDAVAARWFS